MIDKKTIKKLSIEHKRELLKNIDNRILSASHQENIALSGSSPSIDLFMLIKSMAKQLAINNFVDSLSRVEDLETIISPLENEYFRIVNETQEQKKRAMTHKEKDNLRLQLFGENIQKFSDFVKDEVEDVKEDLKKILEANAKFREKNLIKQLEVTFKNFSLLQS